MKLLVPEPGSEVVLDLWTRADRLLSSIVLYPEGRAALARADRVGRIRGRAQQSTRRLLEAFWRDVETIDVLPALAGRAGDLADAHALRGFDAVHLATAEAVGGPDLLLVAADRALTDAARDIGLGIAPV